VKSVNLWLAAIFALMLSSLASSTPETHQLGPFTVSFDMNTNLNYRTQTPNPQGDSLATVYPLIINTNNATGALIRITEYNNPVDSTLVMRGSLALMNMRESGINVTVPESLTVDGKEGFLISGVPPSTVVNVAPGFTLYQSQYWLDSKSCECGPVSVGTTSVDITSTYPQDITTNLLNSLHVGKTESAATPIANITKNVTATPNTAGENVTETTSIASSSAEKAAEKPAAKQPGFESILAITCISAIGYIRLLRKQ
jgi:hypothetical protein